MFSGGEGPWGPDPRAEGWWGEDPPFHVPVFVLTHHARETLVMEGGTSFHFVSDGIEAALEQAKAAAGDQDVLLAGGAGVVQQYLKAGLLRFTSPPCSWARGRPSSTGSESSRSAST